MQVWSGKVNKENICETFRHEYTTYFIVDDSENYKKISELNLKKYDRVFLVVDSNVLCLYKDVIINGIGMRSDNILMHVIEPTEYSKSIDYYPKLITFLANNNAGRYDAVVAAGGGVIIDLVGFTVSTYMRGLPFFVIATTLIGQVDASTAGKTCLNAVNTKNLLGTFYYPIAVYNSIKILSTCSKRIMRQGLSEAFKYSLLTDGILLPLIIQFNNKNLDTVILKEIVEKTIRSRIKIRRVDPLASNLGHTFGHALEKCLNYNILHGDAITIGTIMANEYAVEKSLMTREECDKIFTMIMDAHLNIWVDEKLNVKELVDNMKKDKKSSANRLHLVLLCGIGSPYKSESPFFEAEYDDMERFLTRFINEYKYKCSNYIEFLQKEVLV